MITNDRVRKVLNCICFAPMMLILFLATADESFYDRTVKYYSLVLCFALLGFFVTNVNVIQLLKKKDKNIWILGIAGVLVPIFLWLADSRWGALFTAWNLLLVFYLADEIEIEFKQVLPIYGMQILIFIWFLIDFPKGYNPNHSGMYLLVMFISAMILLSKLEEVRPCKYIYSCIHIIIAGVVIFELLLYRSRTSLVGLLVFEILWLFLKKGFGRKKWFTYLVMLGLTIGDLIFTIIYFNLYKIIGDYKMPIFNKRIMSGRQYAWADFWKGFLSRPLTGIGSDFDKMMPNGSGLEAHNALLSLLTVHGIIIFLVFLYFVFRYFTKTMLVMENNALKAALIAGLLTIFFISVFENALVAGQYATYAFLLTCTYRSKPVNIRKENEDE